ncbi:MAG TPA: DEAD/DEAH box helicase family protein [Solimonas sp.]|nr:DEAD/DEAH box helicase family protein [Solimonas sp.]
MATGSGKTFTAITEVYRLLKHANARRVLFLVLEGDFQVADRGLLALAQANLGGGECLRVERRHCCKAGPQRCVHLGPFAHRLRAMEAEDFTGAGLGVACVGEAGDLAGALVQERQRLMVCDPLELGFRIVGGLLLGGRDVLAEFLPLASITPTAVWSTNST